MDSIQFKSFGIGLLIGLVVAIVVAAILLLQKVAQKRMMNKKMEDLKATLANRMDIESSGVGKIKDDLEGLRKENENMRITLSTLDQKAGRKEIKRLQVYQIALDKLVVSSPGFAPAWQTAVQEAELMVKEATMGSIPLIGKYIAGKSSAPQLSLENKEE